MRPGAALEFRHLAEYASEALGLGLFMVSACGFGALLEHPASAVRAALPDPFARRALMGLAMGLTAIALIYSPFGRRSGAHLNPATTLAFWRLGRVKGREAVAYPLAQVAGGLAGVGLMHALLGPALAHPAVDHVVTRPGRWGAPVAFAAEVAISGALLAVVLHFVAHPRLVRWAGVAAGSLVAASITFESPLSGMSMNPARSLASAAWAGDASHLWIYFTAPPLGMWLAAEAFRRARPAAQGCAKLDHAPHHRCIFCGHPGRRPPPGTFAAVASLEPGNRPH